MPDVSKLVDNLINLHNLHNLLFNVYCRRQHLPMVEIQTLQQDLILQGQASSVALPV